MGEKFVYDFEEGNKDLRDLLGGKGANLAEMVNLGLPVPKGFTITTDACKNYYLNGKDISGGIIAEIKRHLADLEVKTGKTFGGGDNPLLVSVRSGAKFSMPGMMDTILNLGMNDVTAAAMIAKTGNPRFVRDSYRRFIQMFSDVVLGIDKKLFEAVLDEIKLSRGYRSDQEIPAEDLATLINRYKAIVKQQINEDFPTDPWDQLVKAIRAVFDSWNNDRANTYRKLNDIPGDLGTAVNVQEMVFGNTGENSGTGVAFTRNSSNGQRVLLAEYLMNAQGEDVVAGIRTPENIDALRVKLPVIYNQFVDICDSLERHYRDMQDIEFTIEDNKLFILQTRNGKRTAFAAIKIAVDLVSEGLITKEEALLRVDPNSLNQLFLPVFDKGELAVTTPIATAIAASPGAATGRIVFSASDAKIQAKDGPVILVREETSPDDIEGMNVAKGILTARGGLTSHAAVVARGMGKCCVVGCKEASISEEDKIMLLNGVEYHEGDYISLDGTTGRIYAGQIKTIQPNIKDNKEFAALLSWAQELKVLGVRCNADSPRDADAALRFGAEGVGLCRTEHMFFEHSRINAVREMILADTKEERVAALKKIIPYQTQDFIGIFSVMRELSVCIRLLDPPLHEFLPKTQEEYKELASIIGKPVEAIKLKAEALHEFNPMLGHRGIRLAITYPEIYLAQVEAIIKAVITMKKDFDVTVVPEIMLPLVISRKEMAIVVEKINMFIAKLLSEESILVDYKIGTMIELPRAALNADSIASEAEFFSFGTNDLTQTTFGFSRDDSVKFLNSYLDSNVFEKDPFETVDQTGVGKLIDIAIRLGKSTRPDIKLGVCGEHGGEPASIEFFHRIGLTYVSCSPYRVPIAIVAAAQAAIKYPR